MTETLVQWFVETLGGSAAKEVVIFVISMIPILELRGGLLAAGPEYPEASGLPPRRDRLSGWDDRPAVSKIPVPDAGNQGGRPAERNRSAHNTSLGKQ